jgi:hypothetical protein
VHLTTYLTPDDFLHDTQTDLVRNEAANNLMLGIALRIKSRPERFKGQPYFATVMDEGQLLAAALTMPSSRLIAFSPQAESTAAFELIAHDLKAREISVPGVSGRPEVAQAFAETWKKVSGVEYRLGLNGRAYELRKVIPPPRVEGGLRAAESGDVELIAQWLYEFQHEALHGGVTSEEAREMAQFRVGDGDVFLWEDGQPTSMAIRSRPTLTGISIGSVYTPPGLRGKGYASACVAGLSQLCLDSGYKFCMLFTDLANPTSNRIYQKMGYTPVGDYHEYIFDER